MCSTSTIADSNVAQALSSLQGLCPLSLLLALSWVHTPTEVHASMASPYPFQAQSGTFTTGAIVIHDIPAKLAMETHLRWQRLQWRWRGEGSCVGCGYSTVGGVNRSFGSCCTGSSVPGATAPSRSPRPQTFLFPKMTALLLEGLIPVSWGSGGDKGILGALRA